MHWRKFLCSLVRFFFQYTLPLRRLMALRGPGFYPEHSLLIPFPPLMGALAIIYSPKLKPKPLNYWDWAAPTAVPMSITSLSALALVFLFGIWEFSLPFKLSCALKTIVLFYSTYWSIWGYLKCVIGGWEVGNGSQVIFDCHIAGTRRPYMTYDFWLLVVGGPPYSKQNFTFFFIRT